MALHPRSATDLRVSHDVLQRVTERIFTACGMSGADASLLAGALVHADLRGIHSHGVLRVPDYVKKLTVEGVDPCGIPRVVSERGGALVVDGDNSMCQIGGSDKSRFSGSRLGRGGIGNATIGLPMLSVVNNSLDQTQMGRFLKIVISGLVLLAALVIRVQVRKLRDRYHQRTLARSFMGPAGPRSPCGREGPSTSM